MIVGFINESDNACERSHHCQVPRVTALWCVQRWSQVYIHHTIYVQANTCRICSGSVITDVSWQPVAVEGSFYSLEQLDTHRSQPCGEEHGIWHVDVATNGVCMDVCVPVWRAIVSYVRHAECLPLDAGYPAEGRSMRCLYVGTPAHHLIDWLCGRVRSGLHCGVFIFGFECALFDFVLLQSVCHASQCCTVSALAFSWSCGRLDVILSAHSLQVG